MKQFMLVLALSIVSCAPAVAASDVFSSDCNSKVFVHDGKAFRYAEVRGKCLLSNEWSPVDRKGYTEEYKSSKQYQNARYANDNLRKWREK